MRGGGLRIAVVADDLTGATDIGVALANGGLAVRVFTADAQLASIAQRVAGLRTDALVVDTDSRFDEPDVAAAKVRAATRALATLEPATFYKKTCSVLRGPVAAELDAMLDALDEPAMPVVAAFPKNGRTTAGGVHRVWGVPLAESAFARDPVHPRLRSDLRDELRAGARRVVGHVPIERVRAGAEAIERATAGERAAGAGLVLIDAETQDDLVAIAHACRGARAIGGAAGLAEELPPAWGVRERFEAASEVAIASDPSAPVLVTAGSTMPETHRQIAALVASGASEHVLDGAHLVADADAEIARAIGVAVAAITRDRIAIVRSPNDAEGVARTRAEGARRGMTAIDVSRAVSAALARIARVVLDTTGTERLVVLGGDTSAAACRGLGVDELLVVREIAPGVPSVYAPRARKLLVLKSGSFGGDRFAIDAVAHVRALGHSVREGGNR